MEPDDKKVEATERVTLSLEEKPATDAAYFCGHTDGYRMAVHDLIKVCLSMAVAAYLTYVVLRFERG